MDLVNYREKIQRINLHRKYNKEQNKINQLYAEEGLTDRVLDRQIELNKQRNKNNIPDDTEKIYKNYTQ